jgi:hypothetical protein
MKLRKKEKEKEDHEAEVNRVDMTGCAVEHGCMHV